ncbi:SRPBCC family protein, partial [Actinomadura adrarensis]
MSDSTVSSIVIEAGTPEIVQVIADFPAYPAWAEGIKDAEVLDRDGQGRPVGVRFRLEAGPIKDTYVLVYTWTGDGVGWSMREPAKMITRMDGAYRLAGTGDGGTRVTY